MALKLTVRRGGGVGATEFDYSDVLRADLPVELQARGFNGSSQQSMIYVDDWLGEIGSPAGLPPGLTFKGISAHQVVTLTEDASGTERVILRGRVSPKTIGRGDHKMDRERQYQVTIDDNNMHLRGLGFTSPQVRPEETDVARMQWLLGTHLSGSPRLTTDLGDRIVTSSPVTMEEHTYEPGTQPADVLADCVEASGKIGFVNIDDDLCYWPTDDESYRAGIRISDREEEHNTEGVCTPAATATLRVSTVFGGGQTPTAVSLYPVDAAHDDRAIYAAIVFTAFTSEDADAVIAEWRPVSAGNAGNAQVMTKIAEHGAGTTYRIQLWRLLDPNPSESSASCVRWTLPDVRREVNAAWYLSDVDQADPNDTPATNAGTGTTTGLAIGGSGFFLNLGGYAVGGSGPGSYAPSAGGGQTSDGTRYEGGATNHAVGGGGHSSANPTWTLVDSRDWKAIGVAVHQSGTAGVLTFPPIDPKVIEDGQELLSGGIARYGGEGYVVDLRLAVVEDYDYWVEAVHLPDVETATDATARLAKIVDSRRTEDRTYDLWVSLRADQQHCVQAGQMIDVKARAFPDADDQFQTRRIAEITKILQPPDHYLVGLKLDRPIKERGAPGGSGGGAGAKALATKPSNAAQMPYDGSGVGSPATNVQDALDTSTGALASHLTDATDAHDASAISFSPTGTVAATDVQAAIAEVASEAGGSSLTVEDEGTPLATPATILDFVGAGVTATGGGAEKTITIPGGGSVTVQEADGTPSVLSVATIKVGNGDLTDEGSGVVRIKTAADAAGGAGSGAPLIFAGTTIGASPLSVPVPGGGLIVDGDLIVLAGYTVNSNSNAGGPAGSGWNELVRFDTSSAEWQFAYWKIASGESGSWSISHSAGNEACMAVAVFRGPDAEWSKGFAIDSYVAPGIIGHNEGLQVVIWFAAGSGGSNLVAPPQITQDAFVQSGTTNKAQVMIAHRDTFSEMGAGQFVATSTANIGFAGALTVVFYDA